MWFLNKIEVRMVKPHACRSVIVWRLKISGMSQFQRKYTGTTVINETSATRIKKPIIKPTIEAMLTFFI